MGLGNPGQKYKNTRHNFGFWLADEIAKKYGVEFKTDRKLKSELAEIVDNKEKIVLAKPQTFMNESGQAARALLNFFKETPANLIVIHDDSDLPLGEFKLAQGQGSAGHNGVASIVNHLKSKNFWRLRLGVRPKNIFMQKKPAGELVLKNFSFWEKRQLPAIKNRVLKALEL